jgi:hypothetical protein
MVLMAMCPSISPNKGCQKTPKHSYGGGWHSTVFAISLAVGLSFYFPEKGHNGPRMRLLQIFFAKLTHFFSSKIPLINNSKVDSYREVCVFACLSHRLPLPASVKSRIRNWTLQIFSSKKG